MGGIYGFGQRAAQIPGQIGALAKRAFALPGQAQDAFMGAGNAVGAGLREGALEFGAGAFGGPTYEDMDKEVYRAQHPIQSMYEEGASLNGMYDPPPPVEHAGGLNLGGPDPNEYGPEPALGVLSKTMDPQAPPVGALAGSMPTFGEHDVYSGASGDAASGAGNVMRTISGPRSEPESHIRFSMDGGPMEDYTPGQSMPGGALRGSAFGQDYQPAAGGGTLSMGMTAPENVGRVTFASQMEDAEQAGALRQARGEPSPGDIYRYEQQLAQKYDPEKALKIQQAGDVRGVLQRWNEFQQDIKNQVDSRALSPEDAERQLARAENDIAMQIQTLNGQSLAPWGPKPTAFQLPPG